VGFFEGMQMSTDIFLDSLLDQRVVVDLTSQYVVLGNFTGYNEHFLELKNADLHDLRDTETTRENYVAASAATGVKRNRRKVYIARHEMVAIGALDDVVDD
jgi:small nuclear ribonucleoprotein (snRNP)-like protein